MNKDRIRIIGNPWFMEAICFPKKHYPTIDDAQKKYDELYSDGMYVIEAIEEHQVGLFHFFVRTSYEYNEFDEVRDYMFVENYNSNKKYSERFAPTCWCFILKLSKEYTEYLDSTVHNVSNMITFQEFLESKGNEG